MLGSGPTHEMCKVCVSHLKTNSISLNIMYLIRVNILWKHLLGCMDLTFARGHKRWTAACTLCRRICLTVRSSRPGFTWWLRSKFWSFNRMKSLHCKSVLQKIMQMNHQLIYAQKVLKLKCKVHSTHETSIPQSFSDYSPCIFKHHVYTREKEGLHCDMGWTKLSLKKTEMLWDYR